MNTQNITYSIPWNLFLLTIGSILFGIGIKAAVIPSGMISGGFSGASILMYYYSNVFTPGIWFLILNVPVFILGWLFISRRFLLYSLYGTIIATIVMDTIQFEFFIDDIVLATIAGGVIIGAGSGIIFRSLGSAGGNDIISIMLNQKFGISIGSYNFFFNIILFLLSFGSLNTELILYSMVMSFITSQVIEYFMTLFNQRKMIFIISSEPEKITKEIMKKLNRGVTLLKAEGGYTGKPKDVILTVGNTYQIKRIEEIAFNIDPDAFLITENTYNVLGKGFSKRKVY
jgi:uncharacterized membrane-anchored protein YitT (DUF2179 family)